MKLEFGAGERQTPGFKNVDVRDLPGIDYVCEAWKIDEQVEENSVDQVHSRHFMEHLTYYHVDLTMKAWYKILKPGGYLTIVVPCMDFHIRQWTTKDRATAVEANGMNMQQWAKEGFWGKQREVEKGEVWDIHKSGWDFELMKEYLEKWSFKDITRVQDGLKKNLFVRCIK